MKGFFSVVDAALLGMLWLCVCVSFCAGTNISHILSDPQYSTFRSLCDKTGVATQINSRETITVLVPPNSVLDSLVSRTSLSTSATFDLLSYHVLLDYFDIAKFKAMANHTAQITTLYQTTGQAQGKGGFVNATVEGGQIHIGREDKGAPLTSVVQNEIYKHPYNISVLGISTMLVPDGVVGAPSPAPAPVNLTSIIARGKKYSTFLSLIKSTGVEQILQNRDTPPGLTLFVPDDAAFNKLPKGILSSLKNAQLVALLEFHGLPSFYTMQELTTLTGPQQTLASGSGGSTYEIAGVEAGQAGGVVVNTGYNKATVGDSVYSQLPLGIYEVQEVLLPTDIFGLAPSTAPAPAPVSSTPSPSPGSSPSPSPAGPPVPSPATTPSSFASPPAPPHSAESTLSPNSPKRSSAFATSVSLATVALHVLCALAAAI